MRKRRGCLLLAGGFYLSIGASVEAQVPSFDCTKARASDEIVICGTPQLAELDNLVATGYAYLKSTRGRQAADEIGIPFWRLRQTCGSDPSCIRQRQVEAIIAYHAAGAPVLPPDWTGPYRSRSNSSSLQTLGPYNPNFAVGGLALGAFVYPDSAVYKSCACRPSDDFAGFTWCAVHHTEKGKFRPYASWLTILHSSANKVAFITQAIAPAFFEPGDVDREIQRLSHGFGQAQILNADPRPSVPHAVLAAWGAVTLTPLDEAAMEALRRGEEIHRGLIAEFIGDAHESARIGLPVFSIGGGPGYLWGASFDNAGRGSLRISAVDASALGSTQPASPVAPPPTQLASPIAVAPSPPTPSQVVPALPPQQPEQVAPTTSNPPPATTALKTMDVIDFLVDWRSLLRQTVTVTGCLLQQAEATSVVCSAGSQGMFFIDGDTLAREGLRRALRECAGFEKGDECRVDVTGEVSENTLGMPKLLDAAMKWAPLLASPSPQAAPAAPLAAEKETSEAMPTAVTPALPRPPPEAPLAQAPQPGEALPSESVQRNVRTLGCTVTNTKIIGILPNGQTINSPIDKRITSKYIIKIMEHSIVLSMNEREQGVTYEIDINKSVGGHIVFSKTVPGFSGFSATWDINTDGYAIQTIDMPEKDLIVRAEQTGTCDTLN